MLPKETGDPSFEDISIENTREQTHDRVVDLVTKILSEKETKQKWAREGLRIAKGFKLNDGAEVSVHENPEKISVVVYDKDAVSDLEREEKGRNIHEVWIFNKVSSTWSSDPDTPKRKLEEVLDEILRQ